MTIAIEAKNLGKRYYVRGHAPPTAMSALRQLFTRQKKDVFWALQDVNFEIKKGSTIGVIGPNGSGKSSTLGLVTGTIYPTTGYVKTHGRISSLLELGAGFHPDLTGRENIFLNAAILGIPREDISKRVDHIIEFSNLHGFIDQPVRNYSSGMYVRLGFAVAIEMNPDILLIDEVLAVGDIAFQLKCLDRIRNFQRRGKTLLFVSHALQTVEEFCDEAFLIHKGHLVKRGNPSDVILDYIKAYMGEGGYLYTQEFGTRDVEFQSVIIRNEQEQETASLISGKTMHVDIHYIAHKRVEKPVFGYSVKTGNGFYIFGSNTQLQKVDIKFIDGEGMIRLTIDPLTLMQSNFFLSLSIHSWDHETQYHRREDWYPFAVKNEKEEPGIFRLPSRWSQPVSI